MQRAFDSLVVLLAALFGGVFLWPTTARSLPLVLVVGCIVIVGLMRAAVVSRAAALLLGVVSLTVVAEPLLRVAQAAYDMRLVWALLVIALSVRGDRIRVHTLGALGIMVVLLTPPADISLLRVAPPVLLQVVICAIVVGAQRFHSTAARWRWYRVMEPFVGVALVALVLLPFRTHGLSVFDLVRWHAPVASIAALIGLAVELVPPAQPS